MRDELMTVCTYDDESEAWRDCEKLRQQGIESNVTRCRWIDPENPGAHLVDLVVFDEDLARAQEILQVCVPDPEIVPNPEVLNRAQSVFIIVAIVLTLLALVGFAISFW